MTAHDSQYHRSIDLENEEDDNLKALNRLRSLPRGTQVDSRIAAIQALLKEVQVFKTLKKLRWPQGIMCPRCHSLNVARKAPPHTATDQRHYYECLNCQDEGNPSDFDDFTGLPMGSLHALRQWILCWYLIGFCSVNQIAKVLGLSSQEVIQMVSLGSEISQFPDMSERVQATEAARLEKKAREESTKSAFVDKQEEDTRSFSKNPRKPGPKSKL